MKMRGNNGRHKKWTDPRIKQFGEAKYREYRQWFNRRLDDAIKAAEVEQYDEGVDVSSNRELDTGFFFVALHAGCPVSMSLPSPC